MLSYFGRLGRLALLSSSLVASAFAAPSALEQRATKAITFDVVAGASAAVPLPATMYSISIEFCYITDYLGDVGAPNKLTKNLLQQIQNRVGQPPIIRIGGNTQDLTYYCDTCPATLTNVFVDTKGEAFSVTYNKNLFKVMAENVPTKQKYIFGVNLRGNDVKIPSAEVSALTKYMNLTMVNQIELGNEPDLYNKSSRPSWGQTQYNTQVTSWINTMNLLGGAKVGWQLGATYSHKIQVSGVVNGGVNIPNAEQYSTHAYPYSRCTPDREAKVSLIQLVNHTHTTSFLSQWTADAAVSKSAHLPLVMGETGSVSCHGKAGVSNTLSAALWEVDYCLHGAVLGFQGIFFHQGTSFFYSSWNPVAFNGSTPMVWPTYYAAIFVADAMQNLTTPKIHEVTSLGSDNLAVYAIYVAGKVERVVILNTQYYDASKTAVRPEVTVDVSVVLGKTVAVRRLTGADSKATGGVTVAGQSFQTGLPTGALGVEMVATGLVTVKASEAVIIQRQ